MYTQLDANFNGQPVKVGKFGHTLRKHIFRYSNTIYNHIVHNYYIIYYRAFLGLLNTADGDKIVEDPVIESFYKVDNNLWDHCIGYE